MATIKGTETEKNLLKAFAGESQARNRYTYFSSQAKKEGFVQISQIFAITADQEKEHAKRFFKFLESGPLEITATYPAGVISGTMENLEAAAAGEHEEWDVLYPGFAAIAKEEGFNDVAAAFNFISRAEMHHEKRYLALLDNIKKGKAFEKPDEIEWQCLNCGYIHRGKSAPNTCPSCLHPQAYFAVHSEVF